MRNFTLFQNRRLWGLLAAIYLLFITFPGHYMPIGPIQTGLDNSWVYALNELAQSDYIFGQDIAFTYGPLGYLLHPLNIGPNLIYAVAFWVVIHSLLAFTLFYFLFKAKRLLSFFVFIIAYVLAYAISIANIEYYLLLIIGLLLCASFEDNDKVYYVAAPMGGLLAGLSLFMKLNLGLSALTMIIAYGVIWLIKKRQKAWQLILLSGIPYLLTVVFLSKIYFRSYQNFSGWITASLDIVNGYSVAMALVGPRSVLVLGLLVLAVYIVFTLLLLWWRAKPVHAAFIFAGPIFLAFKHGFVRQDAHALIFFTFFLLVFSIFILNATGKKELIISLSGFFVALILTLPVFGSFNQYNLSRIVGVISGQTGWSNVNTLVHLENVRSQIDEQSKVNLAKNRLPAEWIEEIKKSDGTVDVLPWELSYCPANNLNWNPNPTLQTYSAYTSFLDEWSANHYQGNSSPDYLIVEFMAIDGRHLLLDTPATWRNIILNYELILKDSQAGRLLLKRNIQPSQEKLVAINKENAYIDQWILVPPSDNLLFADVDMKLTFWGIGARTLFRIPPVYIDLIYDSGRTISYRIIPDTAKNGLLINFLPSNAEDLSKLITGVSTDRVAKFKISGPGTVYYDKEISLVWKEMPREIKLERLDPKELTIVEEGATLFYIDTINGRQPAQQNYHIIIDTQQGKTITVSGWAVDQKAGQAAGGVFINIDGQKDIPAFYGCDRPDVADHFKTPNYRFSGFSASFATSSLGKGQHSLSLKIVTADKSGYYQPDGKIILEVR